MKQKNIEQIEQYLRGNDADFSDISQGISSQFVDVCVSWGDWKHSHEYLDYQMMQIGYNLVSEEITGEDSSDCYSSTHHYMFASKEEISMLHKMFA